MTGSDIIFFDIRDDPSYKYTIEVDVTSSLCNNI